MPTHLECPICEHLVALDNQQAQPSNCPACQQSVEWVPVQKSSQNEQAITTESLIATVSNAPDITRRPLSGPVASGPVARSLAPPPPTRPVPRPKSAPDDKDQSEPEPSSSAESIELDIAGEFASSNSTHRNVDQQSIGINASKKPRFPTSILVLIGVTATVGMIAVFFMFASGSWNSKSAKEEESDRLNTPIVNPDKKEKPKSLIERLDADERPARVNFSVLEDIWPKVNRYVVAIDIQGANGNSVASGVVIDSKGWIATSYRALLGANTVTVTWPNTDLVDGNAKSTRSDQSLGLVAHDDKLDLAIIAVGRESITELTGVQMGDASDVVTSQTLIAAAQPASDRRLWLKDCRVARRPKFDELHPVFRSILKSETGLEEKPKFLVHSGTRSPAIAGSPLFNEEGQLVAMSTMLTVGNETLAVPVSAVEKLASTNDGQIHAFKPADDLDRAHAANPGNQGDGTTDHVASALNSKQSTKPKIVEIENADQAIKDVFAFEFWPENQAEYGKLKALAESLFNLSELAVENVKNPEQHEMLEIKSEELLESIRQQLDAHKALSVANAAKVNELFLAGHENGEVDYFVAFGSVKYTAFQSPKLALGPDGSNLDTITFQLANSNRLLVTTMHEDALSPIAEENVLMIGRTRPERFNLQNDGKPQEVILSDILYLIVIDDSE